MLVQQALGLDSSNGNIYQPWHQDISILQACAFLVVRFQVGDMWHADQLQSQMCAIAEVLL